MGIELHYTPDPLTTLLKNHHDPVTAAFNPQDPRVSCNNRLLKVGIRTGFDLLQEPMDRLLEQCSRESVRNTMLKHEEIFRQQVHELHRLYRVQKMLMAELRSKEVKLHSLEAATASGANTDARTGFWGSTSTSETSHSSNVGNRQHSTGQTECNSLHRRSKMAGLSSWERSICSQDPSRTQKGFDLELPPDEETSIGAGASKDQTTALRKHLKEAIGTEGPDSWADGESDIELTLSIGFGSDQKKPRQGIDRRSIRLGCSSKRALSETRELLSSTPLRLERREECSDPSTSFDREGLQRPGWLFQALSLNNRT